MVRGYTTTEQSKKLADILPLESAEMFPELKESKDERIRKELLEHCKNQAKPYIYTGNKCPQIQSWIDWLEKQGEQKPAEEIISNLDYISPKDKALFKIATVLSQHEDKNGSPLEEIKSILVDYGINNLEANEQKPIIEMKSPEESLGISSEEYNKIVDECIYGEQKPAWSEEDERIYKVVLELIDSYSKGTIGGCIIPPNVERYAKWFKALKDRILPQPKQEWSEEDERKLNDVIRLIENSGYVESIRKHYVDWLKSLRLQNTWKPSGELDEASYQVGIKRVLENPESYGLTKHKWKPSDEQMETLLSEVTAWTKGCPKQIVLESLYNDLKKLKG